MEPANINYDFLLHAIDYFKKLGFKYLEVPWLVSKEAIEFTFKGQANPIFQNLYPVGSGEQSFLQLEIDGKLKPGKYVCMTPCFREEVIHNLYTRPHFMKVELYITENITENSPYELASLVKESMDHLLNTYVEYFIVPGLDYDFELLQTEDGYDIMFNGIEVGSYGIREHNGHKWLYGTALAEPRFSTVLNEILDKMVKYK